MEHEEASFENFSGTNGTFNQSLAGQRGLYRAKDKKSRATIQIQVENFTGTEQVYELFNSNNSIALQPDDSLYAGRTRLGGAYKPLDNSGLIDVTEQVLLTTGTMQEPLASFSRKGNLLLIDNTDLGGIAIPVLVLSGALKNETNPAFAIAVKVSMKSTLQGNTYRRFIEKMKTSVIHVTDWKIQCLNEAQFQLPIGQKDFSITGASSDDEFQVSSSISSKDFNTKIVEIGDKQLLVDGDTRLSGIILPNTTMVFTFEIDIINETTKRVF